MQISGKNVQEQSVTSPCWVSRSRRHWSSNLCCPQKKGRWRYGSSFAGERTRSQQGGVCILPTSSFDTHMRTRARARAHRQAHTHARTHARTKSQVLPTNVRPTHYSVELNPGFDFGTVKEDTVRVDNCVITPPQHTHTLTHTHTHSLSRTSHPLTPLSRLFTARQLFRHFPFVRF